MTVVCNRPSPSSVPLEALPLQKRFSKNAAKVVPGLLLISTVALVSQAVAPLTAMPAVAVALIAGMLLAPVGAREEFSPGIAVGIRDVLRFGVALLGAQITIGQLLGLGPRPFVIAISAVFASLVVGYLLARAAQLSREFSWVSAAAVAICGASAALAVSVSVSKRVETEENAAVAIAGITVIGTLAMIAYPLLAKTVGLDDAAAGIFFGASLHEVVQAVGAGFALSDVAGEAATTVKLVRVACLAPVIMILSWRSRAKPEPGDNTRLAFLPGFLLAFIVFASLSSLGAFPPTVLWLLSEASRLCLLVAIAALGMKVSPQKMLERGPQPIVALLGQTAFIAVFAMAAIFLLGLA